MGTGAARFLGRESIEAKGRERPVVRFAGKAKVFGCRHLGLLMHDEVYETGDLERNRLTPPK